MTQKYLILDFETRSATNLKKIGQNEYAKHKSTSIICAAFRYGTREELYCQLKRKQLAELWVPDGPNVNQNFNFYSAHPDYINVAHNAAFEQAIKKHILKINNQPEDWICTASIAQSLALPRSLEGACSALNLPIQKDMEGRRLMMKYSKPRRPTKADPTSKWHSDPQELQRIYNYCRTDVDAETMLFLTIPPLNETERKVWCLDQKINQRGFKVDKQLVDSVLEMIERETIKIDEETSQITKGEVRSTTQRDATLEWLRYNGCDLEDLTAKNIIEALPKIKDGKCKRLLEIRQSVSKTSNAKYSAFDMRSRSDGRVRDNLIYHGASTGRWSGSGVQIQNLPRPQIADTDLAAEIVREGDLELVRLIYGNPMEAFSSVIRSVIIASKGCELFCADYASIEARVLFWVADHEVGVKAFEDDRPLYEMMASSIYRREITKNDKLERSVGKMAVLGCGYGMGAKKFLESCQNFGITIDQKTADIAVAAYRETHYKVPKLWAIIERAAISAVQNPDKSFKINHTTWYTKHKFLWCELPSGRKLAYYKPEVRYENTPWGERRPKLYHYSINPMTRKWDCAATYGGRLVENVVQAIARDLMADAMLNIEKARYEIILSVHDELLAEREKGLGDLKEFETLMSTPPEWAKGLPIKVEGWKGERYRK